MAETLNINTYGRAPCARRVKEGRIVNTASASGPNYNSAAASAERAMLTSPDVTWEELDACMQKAIQERLSKLY
eukprot:g9147.t1